MKMLLFIPVFFCALALARGGDTIPNGGGLSEQALVSSAHQFSYFTESCLLYKDCGGGIEDVLKELKTCELPSISALRFVTTKEIPELDGHPYFHSPGAPFYINRESIYPMGRPMRLPDAFGFLTRIYLDSCGIEDFASSQAIAQKLARFIDGRTEQVTVGKDDIDLPIASWIRLRSFHSDLVIEGPKELLRLSCPQDRLESCTLTNSDVSAVSEFKNLSLASETLENKTTVHFEVVGHFINSKNEREKFSLKATYVDGSVTAVSLQDRELTLPEEEP